jgi:hypothetical protein
MMTEQKKDTPEELLPELPGKVAGGAEDERHDVLASRSPSHSLAGNIFRLLILVLIVLAPVATAVDIVAVSAATIATSVAVDVTTSIISTTNISTTPTDYTTVITNGGIASTNIASTIASWTSLSSSITAAAGKAVTLTLSTPFDMAGFQSGSAISIGTAETAITIVGNGAVFDTGGGTGGKDRFFLVEQAAALVMSNVTLQNAVRV